MMDDKEKKQFEKLVRKAIERRREDLQRSGMTLNDNQLIAIAAVFQELNASYNEFMTELEKEEKKQKQ